MSDPSLFDDLDHRWCRRCGAVKPVDEFSMTLRPSGTPKFGSYCAPCRTAYQHEWYLANREKCLAAPLHAEQRKRSPPLRTRRWRAVTRSAKRPGSGHTPIPVSKATPGSASPSPTSPASAQRSVSHSPQPAL